MEKKTLPDDTGIRTPHSPGRSLVCILFSIL